MPVPLSKKTAIYIQSEALIMINYSAKLHVLEAAFKNNKIYHYKNVPLKKWKAFLEVIEKGLSAGEFINKEIKPFYTYEHIN